MLFGDLTFVAGRDRTREQCFIAGLRGRSGPKPLLATREQRERTRSQRE